MAARAVAARAVEVGDSESVPSPCTSVCRIHEGSGLCRGCFRTLAEIAQWSRMDDPGKRRVWACIARRIEEATAP
nr:MULTISPECIES: DUF1289 domain-containing protein [unclassified Variovorax]